MTGYMKLNFGFGEEWKELKKFKNLNDEQRSIVFYAENKASMNHFRLLISELTKERNFQICYVTSVKNDPILSINDKKKTKKSSPGLINLTSRYSDYN